MQNDYALPLNVDAVHHRPNTAVNLSAALLDRNKLQLRMGTAHIPKAAGYVAISKTNLIDLVDKGAKFPCARCN
jgi:hypothetical protein